jgi:hypothetical protein
MTGAKNLVGSDQSLSMQLPNAKCDGIRCTGVRIILDANDTYTVEAVSVRNHQYKVLATRSDVYCDNLQAIFTSLTGLDTHL